MGSYSLWLLFSVAPLWGGAGSFPSHPKWEDKARTGSFCVMHPRAHRDVGPTGPQGHVVAEEPSAAEQTKVRPEGSNVAAEALREGKEVPSQPFPGHFSYNLPLRESGLALVPVESG